MKTSLRVGRSAWTSLCIFCLLSGLRGVLLAQTNFFPVVTIRATDPFASFAGDPGTFTVFRDGSTSNTLDVFYFIRGTATNGYDYGTIGSAVIIPAGATANTITIWPTHHGQTMTKTATLQLGQPPGVPPVSYAIGYPSNATVYIQPANTTNIPPTVRILTPTNGAAFYTPVNVLICAGAADPDGFVSTVEFFAGTNSLGTRTNNPMSAGPANPFCLIWSNVPPADFVLTALATDNGGASTWSDPVKISVLPR